MNKITALGSKLIEGTVRISEGKLYIEGKDNNPIELSETISMDWIGKEVCILAVAIEKLTKN